MVASLCLRLQPFQLDSRIFAIWLTLRKGLDLIRYLRNAQFPPKSLEGFLKNMLDQTPI